MKNFLLFLLAIFTAFTLNKSFAQNKVSVNVRDFGATGDGKHDDYPALLKVADYINTKGQGEVYFPAGTYYIAEFHNGKNDIPDIKFENCDGLTIYGSNAVISVNGSFNRALSRELKHKLSNIIAITPLKIVHCRNVTIKNLEFNGNVDKMTRDTGVVEREGHLLQILESQNVTMSDLFLHHAQTDGLNIKGNTTKNVIGKGIISSNNARCGMGIIGLADGTFTDCKFINTGLTEGKYGAHAPSAGVDIEPVPKMFASNIRFVNSLFANNKGAQFVCSRPETTKNIFLKNCSFTSAIESKKYPIIVNAVNVVFDSCDFDCKNGSIYPVWHTDNVSSIFKRCTIKSSGSGFIAVNSLQHSSVLIDSCNLVYTGKEQPKNFFPYLDMPNLSFTNNTVQIPKQYNKTGGTTTLIKKASTSNNKFLQ